MQREELISPYMVGQNIALHSDPAGFGGDGWKHAETVYEFAKKLKASTILDYGCGQGALKRTLETMKLSTPIAEYDPAIKGKDKLPSAADLVVCTDVLEHIEPDKLDSVLRHLYQLTNKGAYLVIATRLANKILPDGRNAHLIVESPQWWFKKVSRMLWVIDHTVEKNKGDGRPHDYRIWLRR